MLKLLKLLMNVTLLLFVIGSGVVGARYIIAQQKPLEHEEKVMEPRPVETITVSKDFYTPTVTAYGNVEPAITYEGKAQVSGKISFIHPDLKAGGSISGNTVVLEIDPEDYQTSLAQGNADLAASKSQLAQLLQEEKNTQQSLRIALQNLHTEQKNRANVKRKAAPINKNTQLIQRNIQLAKQDMNITRKNLQLAKNDLQLAKNDLPLTQRNLALANQELGRLKQLRARKLIAINQLEAQQSVVLQQQQQVSQQKQLISQKQQQILQLDQSILKQQQAIIQQEQQLTQQDQSVAGQDQNEAQQQQQILQYQKNVTDLQGQLNTYQSRRANAQAQIRRAEQQVKSQETILERTKVIMPFDARITTASLEKGEYVSVGNSLFEAINTDGVEIRAELPLKDLAALFTPLAGQTLDLSTDNATAMLDSLGLSARVKLVGSGSDDFHDGSVIRIAESVDPLKRTLGIVVAVENPWTDSIIGERPPLLKGMYVQIDIMAPMIDAIVVPRNAVHQGRVFVMDKDDRLAIRAIDIKTQDSLEVVIDDGLVEDERLIVSDLVPVIPGMPLILRKDLIAQNTKDDNAKTAKPVQAGSDESAGEPVPAADSGPSGSDIPSAQSTTVNNEGQHGNQQ